MGFYADFVTDISGIVVSGVTRKQAAPPRQVQTAMLPLMFPRLPQGVQSVEALSGGTGLKRIACELVVVLEPIGQSTTVTNFSLALTIMDGLDAALTTLAAADNIVDDWTIRLGSEVSGDTEYWVLIATVSGSGN